MKIISNQSRFDIMRGYYDTQGFHSKGGRGINLNNLLNQMEFDTIDNFSSWFESLTEKEIEEGKKEWCSGNCCQSILRRLLELGKHEKANNNK